MDWEVDEHRAAFGEHTGIPKECRECIHDIKYNKNYVNEVTIRSSDAVHFTNLAWELLGRYIANNTYLEKVDLNRCGITDEKMTSLFRGLVKSVSLIQLLLAGNEFGIDGVQCMVPFLRNAANLSTLNFNGNHNINTDCFEILIRELDGRSIKKLRFYDCKITDLSALDTYTDLVSLDLGRIKIGREGCRTLSKLLQSKESSLEVLCIAHTGVDDEGVEIIANSLKHNTKLKGLGLSGNNITERGCRALLKLLIDIRSIENTRNSNHALIILQPNSYRREEHEYDVGMWEHVQSAVKINKKVHQSPEAAGRAKVIEYQLNSQNRKEVCRLQGIEYSAGSNFADIEPTLLPRILALICREHGQSEFYSALIPMVPDLMSCVDTSGMIKDEMARNSAQAAALTRQANALIQQASEFSAKNDQLSRRLAARYSTIEEDTREAVVKIGKKRQRS